MLLLYWWCYYAYVDAMSMMWWCYHYYEILLWLRDYDVVVIMRFLSFIMTSYVYLSSLMKYNIYDMVRGYQPMLLSIYWCYVIKWIDVDDMDQLIIESRYLFEMYGFKMLIHRTQRLRDNQILEMIWRISVW